MVLIVTGPSARPRAWSPCGSLLKGTVVWAAGYVVLPKADVYKPMWEYDPKTLWKNLSAHLAYGTGTAATFAWLTRD